MAQPAQAGSAGQGAGGTGAAGAGASAIMPALTAGTGGALGGAGGAASAGKAQSCGEPGVPAPEPESAPSALSLDAGAKTTLKAGNFDDAGTNVLAPSAGAGFVAATRSGAELWRWAEAGAWLEYSVEVTAEGSYSVVVMYYAEVAGGVATITVDDSRAGVVRFGARDEVGEYGGVPNCCARGHGVHVVLTPGKHRLRVTVSPRSVPVDVYGLQLNYAGQVLDGGGQVHLLPASQEVTTMPGSGAADFYRMNFDAERQAWPCEKSFCRVEYDVQPEQAGRYALSLQYAKLNEQCMGVGFQLEDAPLAAFRLDEAATVTAPVELELPCGVTRISVRNPNYVDGEFCSYGAMFGALQLSRLP